MAAAAALLSQRWGVALPAPAEMFCGMVNLPLPGDEAPTEENAKRWHDRLWSQHRIEVPVLAFSQKLWLRISAQVYNDDSDIERLGSAVDEVLAVPSLLGSQE